VSGDPLVNLYLDAHARAAALAPPGRRLVDYPIVTPAPEQLIIVRAALTHAAGLGLTLPPGDDFRVTFHDAPPDVSRGTAERLEDQYHVRLRADLHDHELALVVFHESQHASDQVTERWALLSVEERERRALAFQARAMETFPL
jgi:hypothetical protein